MIAFIIGGDETSLYPRETTNEERETRQPTLFVSILFMTSQESPYREQADMRGRQMGINKIIHLVIAGSVNEVLTQKSLPSTNYYVVWYIVRTVSYIVMATING